MARCRNICIFGGKTSIPFYFWYISIIFYTAGEKLLDAEDDVDAADARDGIIGGAGVGPDPLDSESDQALLRRLRQSQARQFTLHLPTIPIKLLFLKNNIRPEWSR